LKLEVAVGSEVYGVVKLYCTCLILRCVGDCVVFYNSINEKWFMTVTSSMIMKTYYQMGLLHRWWSMVLKFRSLSHGASYSHHNLRHSEVDFRLWKLISVAMPSVKSHIVLPCQIFCFGNCTFIVDLYAFCSFPTYMKLFSSVKVPSFMCGKYYVHNVFCMAQRVFVIY
jgi:hypothetical protein